MGSFRVLNDDGKSSVTFLAGNWQTDGIAIVTGVANALEPNSGYLARAANGQVASLTSTAPAQINLTQEVAAVTIPTQSAAQQPKPQVAPVAPIATQAVEGIKLTSQSADAAKSAIASLGAKFNPTTFTFEEIPAKDIASGTEVKPSAEGKKPGTSPQGKIV